MEHPDISLKVLQFEKPFAIFLGDVNDPIMAKTAFGLRDWGGDACIGQVRHHACTVDLGLPDFSIEEAARAGARSLVLGIAPAGGRLPLEWKTDLLEALQNGMDIVHGLHEWLSEDPLLASAAKQHRRKIHDVRRPPAGIAVGTGEKRSGYRLLTVGTDCAVGKKYSALAIHQCLTERGWSADFRATGQTGIMINGSGIVVDAVVADFISGAAESLSPAADERHWDVIEGQGSLFHPAYAGVSLGLLHGSQPDAIVLCHQAGRKVIDGLDSFPVPDLTEAVARNLQAAALTNAKVRCVGLSINTSSIPPEARPAYLAELSATMQLPCVDPLATGVSAIVDEIERQFSRN